MRNNPFAFTSTLLTCYSFDLGGSNLDHVIQNWLKSYPPKWVAAAVVEALYQGRYKAASVDSILSLWHLHGQQKISFDLEFADLVCRILLKRRLQYRRLQKRLMVQRQLRSVQAA